MIFSCLLVLGFISIATQASADVFYWVGNTVHWDEPNNWISDQKRTNALPGEADHVVFSAMAKGTSITLKGDVQVASLHMLDDRPFFFQGVNSAELSISGNFILNDQTTLGKGLGIMLNDQQGVHTYSFSKKAAGQVAFKSSVKSPSSSEYNLGKSGSCPFFTIVPDPSAPTCNGFNDGIASVIPPADGVGPFAYQWIGGPTTPTWINRSAGTYTVIVTDLGQAGASCNIDVFVNEPGPLTVFSMNATPPTCADGCDGAAAPLVIGGNGGYAYTWSSGETGFTASNLCSTFTLNIEDNEGCQFDTTFVFTNIPDQIVADATVQDVICNGDEDGAISILASGGTGTLTFSWSGPNGFSDTNSDIANLEPGTYTLTVEDASNCFITEVYIISENPEIDLTSTQINNPCAGDAAGSINVTISGGLPPFDFSWSGPNSFVSVDQNIQNLESGTYDLSVTDMAGCVVTLSVEITSPLPLGVDISGVNVLCNGENTGSASALANGGTPPYSYAWTGPSGFVGTGPSISALGAGTYEVQVTDDAGCTIFQPIDITEAAEITASFTEIPITCAGGNDGSINLTTLGGVDPITFAWSGPGAFSSTNQNISGLSAGTYVVVITDASNCSISQSYDLADPPALIATGTAVGESCAVGADGSVTTTISGGAPPYSFSWTGPGGFASTQQNISGLPAGVYALELSDDIGCTQIFSFTVDPPIPLTATFDLTHNICFGDTNGEIVSTPTSGVGPYTYLWIGPGGFISMQPNNTGLVSGEYNLQLTDATGCTSFFTVEILGPPEITIARVITPVTCFGGSNGAISITAAGGTPGYTYQWMGPNGFSTTNEDITGLQAGSYEITVTDINGCTRTRIFNVTSPSDFVIDSTVTDVICTGDSDGAISVTVTDGTGPFSYAWSGPNGFMSADQNISNIPAGDYTLVVTGNLGCTKAETYTVSETSVITVSAVVTPISCFGFADGAIEITIDGGLPPYTAAWTGPNGYTGAGESISNLEPGTYTTTVEDAGGCVQTFDFEVSQPDEIAAIFDLINPLCFGGSTGAITAQLSGGTPGYTIGWTGPNGFTSASANVSGLVAGTYELTATDLNGCIFIDSVELVDPEEIIISVDQIDPTCQELNGSATASATGGSGALSFEWFDDTGISLVNGVTLANVGAGIFVVEVSDENGCIASETVTLSDFTGTIDGIVGPVTCFGGTDGAITIAVTGGLPPYDFLWNGPDSFTSTSQNVSGLGTGQYTVSVTDANNCVSNQAFDVDGPTEITGDPVVTGFSCLENDGSIELIPSGGTPGYIINWSGPGGFTASGTLISNLVVGTYDYTIQDANGCEVVGSAEMIPGPGVSVAETITDALCGDENTGSIETVISGGLAPYELLWDGPNGFSSDASDIFNLEGGSYALTVTDGAGCAQMFAYDVLQPDSISVELDITQPDCLADNGSITATISGGTVALDYVVEWTDEGGNTLSMLPVISNLGPGNYTLTVTDDNGCTIQETVSLSNPGVDADVDITEITCFGFTDGAISLTLTQGVEPATVSWTGPNGFFATSFSISDLSTGIYTYEIQDADGCQLSAQVMLNEPEELLAMAEILPACFEESSGAISIAATGGTPPYSPDWSGPDGFNSQDVDLSGLAPGTYVLTLTDFNGCTFSDDVVVPENAELTADLTTTSVLCFGEAAATAEAIVAGGTAPYELLWSGPNAFTSDQASIADLIAGDYTLTVTDSIGCIADFQISITESEPITPSVTFVSPGCAFDGSLGSISLSVSGGIPDYTVAWTGPNGFVSDLLEIVDLEAGQYTYSITDSAGCGPVEGMVDLIQATPISVDAILTDVSCFGDENGSIELQLTGGIAPYTVSWVGPDGFISDAETIASLAPGTYDLNVIDDAGCSTNATFEILEPAVLTVALIQSVDASCNTSFDGLIEVDAGGGVPPYNYSWTGPDGFTAETPLLENVAQGAYSLNLTDSNDCVAQLDVNLGFMIEVSADAGSDQLICFSDMPQVIAGTGENVDLFNWLNLEGDTLAFGPELTLNLEPGSYTYVFLAGNGACNDLDTLEVTVPELPIADAGIDREVFAEEIFELGGAPTSPDEVTYSWNPSAEGDFDNTAANPSGFVTETTLFVLIVTDINGCQNSDSVLISVLPELNITSGFTPNGDGVNDAWIIDNMELFPNNVVSIFNRWGTAVYQTNRYNMSNAWDGTFEGNPVPAGTYYYTIELNDPRFTEPFTGPITIYR